MIRVRARPPREGLERDHRDRNEARDVVGRAAEAARRPGVNPTEAVLDELAVWVERTPREINNGECAPFAEAVAVRLRGAGRLDVLEVDSSMVAKDVYGGRGKYGRWIHGAHVWVWCAGLHYDAECPEGVPSWQLLPFFRRQRAGLRRMGLRRRDPYRVEHERLAVTAAALEPAWQRLLAERRRRAEGEGRS